MGVSHREEEKKDEKKSDEEDQMPPEITSNVLRGLGNIIPGLGELIKGLNGSKAFQERLRAIDKKVEERLKGKESAGTEPKQMIHKEAPVELFDEGDYLRIIAEIPGIEEDDIKVDLHDEKLAITVNTPQRKYHREIILAFTPRGIPKKVYKNGILEIAVEK